VYERLRGEVKRLQKDPSPRVRAAALHVEQDACLIEELVTRLDHSAEQGRRYSDADWLQSHRRRQATRYWRNLVGRFPLPARLVAAVIAWTRQTAPVKMPVTDPPGSIQGREPVFSSDVLAFVSRPDPTFAQHGFIRPQPRERVSHTSQTRPFR
jgi:hypothetical protein